MFCLYNDFCFSVSELLVSLMNTMKQRGMPHWILVLPLFHLLTGTVHAFETPNYGKFKYGEEWAGLQRIQNPANMGKQQNK